ncbi:MAG: recombinase family protein [Enterocloster clostridioformis]
MKGTGQYPVRKKRTASDDLKFHCAGESESISTNNRWAIVRRFQNGTYTISSPAYGYVNDENGELVIEQEEAAVVRRIFDSYLGGKGSYAIARELRQEGLPTIRCIQKAGRTV